MNLHIYHSVRIIINILLKDASFFTVIHPVCYNKTPQTGYFTFWRQEVRDRGGQHGWVRALLLCPHTVEGAGALGGLFHMTLTPFIGGSTFMT